MENVAEIIETALFKNGEFNELEFVTWTGEPNSFIVKRNGREYRVEVTEETLERTFTVSYDYQDVTESHPFTLSSIKAVFDRFEDDAGLIVKIEDMTYFFESMEDYYDDTLTCWDEDGTAIRSQRPTMLHRLITAFF